MVRGVGQANKLRCKVRREEWRLEQPFIISRDSTSSVSLVVVELEEEGCIGRGEACPTPHYGESAGQVIERIEELFCDLNSETDWDSLHDRIAPGAARNAVDCAVWDLRAKKRGGTVARLLGLEAPRPVTTVFTISLNAPEVMAAAATAADGHELLKLKLGAPSDRERIRAVRRAVPDKRLIVDANEAWTATDLRQNLPVLVECGVEMLEQPLPAGEDAVLAEIAHPIAIGADESCHVTADIEYLAGRYDMVNIKLDKTGGLTEAMRLLKGAQNAGLETMVGCMLGTSLAMAPAMLVAQSCRYADLDAPLLLGSDREPAMRYAGGQVYPAPAELWG